MLTRRNALTIDDPNRFRDLGLVRLPPSSSSSFTKINIGPVTSFESSGLSLKVGAGDGPALVLNPETGSKSLQLNDDIRTDADTGGRDFRFIQADDSFFDMSQGLGLRTFISVPSRMSLPSLAFVLYRHSYVVIGIPLICRWKA